MHTAESDYFKNVCFGVFEFVTSFKYVLMKYLKASQRNNNSKTSNYNRRLASYWLCGVMHTAELDSAEGCTPCSLTPLWVCKPWSFSGTLFSWLGGEMHIAESDSAVRCTLRSFLKIWISGRNQNQIYKYFSLFYRGLDGFKSWKNGGRKSHDTLPLRDFLLFCVNLCL